MYKIIHYLLSMDTEIGTRNCLDKTKKEIVFVKQVVVLSCVGLYIDWLVLEYYCW